MILDDSDFFTFELNNLDALACNLLKVPEQENSIRLNLAYFFIYLDD